MHRDIDQDAQKTEFLLMYISNLISPQTKLLNLPAPPLAQSILLILTAPDIMFAMKVTIPQLALFGDMDAC